MFKCERELEKTKKDLKECKDSLEVFEDRFKAAKAMISESINKYEKVSNFEFYLSLSSEVFFLNLSCIVLLLNWIKKSLIKNSKLKFQFKFITFKKSSLSNSLPDCSQRSSILSLNI